ncbi:MAG: AAA family ATPase [Solirubrobacteraceae bacterium]
MSDADDVLSRLSGLRTADGRAAGDGCSVEHGLTVRTAGLDRAQPPRWAWEQRIVRGYLNLLLGNEGIGKSTAIAWMLARLTRGELPGDLQGHPVTVAVLGDEDSFDDVWTPRLHAAGADLARVVQVERPDGGFVNVKEDREKLALVVKEHEIGLVYLDQLLDNLGVGTDDWRQKAVRDALQPLRSLARELDIAAVGCLHPNKRADSFRQLIAGAPAFNSVSRSSLLLAQHPDDEHRRVLVRGKGNLSKTPTAIEFEITSHRFTANNYTFDVPLAHDFSEGTLTVDDLVGDESTKTEHSRIAEACEIVEALLPRDGGWHPAKAVKEACIGEGIEDHTVKRAKARLHIEHRRTDTFPAATEWRWPHSQDAHGSPVRAVPSVPTVPSANGRDPLRSSSENTQNRQDSGNERPHCVPTADLGADWTEDELQTLADTERGT